MKKLCIYLSLLITFFLFSCDSSIKLNQENAEIAIKEFVSENAYSTSQNTFDINSIAKIEPLYQFSENEASVVVNFNFKPSSWSDDNLIIKVIFKRNLDKQWILTSVEDVQGGRTDYLYPLFNGKWKNLNILVQ